MPNSTNLAFSTNSGEKRIEEIPHAEAQRTQREERKELLFARLSLNKMNLEVLR